MNIRAQLELELSYLEFVIQHFSHHTTETTCEINQKYLSCTEKKMVSVDMEA